MSNELRPESRPALEAHVADFAGVATVAEAFQHNLTSRHAEQVDALRELRERRQAALEAELLQLGSLAAQPEYTQNNFELAA